MQMTLTSQGRSASALTGALSGNGTVTLESAAVAGLDPRAFEVAIRASDSGQAADDVRLRQIVERALAAGAMSVASAQIPFTIGDGRIRIGATTLDAEGARAIVSGGYDIPADQADIASAWLRRRRLASSGRPEIQLFAVGTPDALEPHRRCRGAVVMAGGAGDRPRNPAARCDRTRRAAAAGSPPFAAASRRPGTVGGTPDAVCPACRRPKCRFPAAIHAGLRRRPRPSRHGRRLRRPIVNVPAARGPDSECAGGQSAGGAAAAGDRGQTGTGSGQAEAAAAAPMALTPPAAAPGR